MLWQGNCRWAGSTSMLTFCMAEAGKTTFPRLLCCQSLGSDSGFPKGIPLKDVDLEPELRERARGRLGQSLAGMDGGSEQLVRQGLPASGNSFPGYSRRDPVSYLELFLETPRLSSSSPSSDLASHQGADFEFLSDEAN